jgi:hypothetical protein
MTHRLARHLRANVIAYLALFLAVGGGGYALAATRHTNTITACANKKTGELFLHSRGRCKRGQKRVTWNQRGPQGVQGVQGAPGPPGAPAVNAWAVVSGAGGVVSGSNISVAHTAAGTYQVTVSAPTCVNKINSPTVTVLDANPPNGQGVGAFPTAWVGGSLNQQFTVFTGVVAGGAFTATDDSFDIHDSC